MVITAPNAFSGIVPYYLVETLPYSEGCVHCDYYWIDTGGYLLGPNMLLTDPPSMVYYLAYRLSSRRNEWVVGPDSVDCFVRNVKRYAGIANLGYIGVPPGQQVPDYQAKSARAILDYPEGNPCKQTPAVGIHFDPDLIGEAWKSAAKDPGWWAQTITSTAGALSRVPATPRGTAPPPTLRVVQGGGATPAAIRFVAPILATEGNAVLAPSTLVARAPVVAPRLTVLSGGRTVLPGAPAPTLLSGTSTSVVAATAPSILSIPALAPEAAEKGQVLRGPCLVTAEFPLGGNAEHDALAAHVTGQPVEYVLTKSDADRTYSARYDGKDAIDTLYEIKTGHDFLHILDNPEQRLSPRGRGALAGSERRGGGVPGIILQLQNQAMVAALCGYEYRVATNNVGVVQVLRELAPGITVEYVEFPWP